MTNSSKPPPNAGKFLNRELLKANLSFAALFLTAFELLKLSVIGAVENVLAWFPEDAKQIERYEAELGIRFDQRDERGLLPSANWLFRIDVLTQDEIEVIKAIRNHRNEIAHELPRLLWEEGADIRVDLIKQARHLTMKIDVWSARNDVLFDLGGNEEIDLSEVPDEEILSGRLVILDYIIDTVTTEAK